MAPPRRRAVRAQEHAERRLSPPPSTRLLLHAESFPAVIEIVRAFCIGHVPPVFAPPLPYTMLCPKPLGLANELVIADARFGPDINGAMLAEYSQLFGLQDLIEAGDLVADKLYLFQYRKFVGFQVGGTAANVPWVRITSPLEAATLFPSQAQLEAAPHAMVVGSVAPLGSSMAKHYANVHVIDDLVMFAAVLPGCGLKPADIRQFSTLQGLIPSPALCLVDTVLFLRQIRVLRAAWDQFARHYHVQREGYQMRVAGYLLERLHSHLLCQWLMDGSQPDVGLGHRYVVVDRA